MPPRCDNASMGERRCRYCEELFQPAKFQPRQTICNQPDCQRRRRSEYHRRKIADDIEYQQVCLDSARKWRANNPDYWKQYRRKNVAAAEHNRDRQRLRDRKRRLRELANNNSAFDLKSCAAEVWLLGSGLSQLANNNPALVQVWVLEALPARRGPTRQACKQHRSGFAAASAG